MFLIDTDILIWAIRGNRKVLNLLDSLKDQASTYISSVSIAEIYKNIFPSEILKTDEIIHSNIILSLEEKTAKQAGLYWRDFSPQLKNLSLTDCMIAATAKIFELTLITSNTRHFPMADIKVKNPLKQ